MKSWVRPLIGLILFSACILPLDLFAQKQEKPVRARIILRTKQTWNSIILGRYRNDWLLIQKEGEQGTIELPTSDIMRIDFPLHLDPAKVLDLYALEEFGEVTRMVSREVAPYKSYIMEAGSNIDSVFSIWLKSLYWEGKTVEALALAAEILSLTKSGRPWLDAMVVKALCLARNGDTNGASVALDQINSPPDDTPEAGMVGYTRAIVQMDQNNLDKAQESLARLITFRSRDFEWMPAALYLSATGYARVGEAYVARQIVNEIKLNHPMTRWARQAESLNIEALLPAPREADSAELITPQTP